MRSIVALVAAGVLLGMAGGTAPAQPAYANVDNFVFDSFDAVYELDRDAQGRATLLTTETLVARFPDIDQNRGIRRTLPAQYQGRTTELTVLSVTDERGEPRRFDVESSDGITSVVSAVPEGQFVRGVQTYVITYSQRDTVDAFANTGAEEFYWNVNGTDWRQPFGRVTATVRLGPGLAEQLTGGVFCYQGYQGSTEQCRAALTGSEIRVGSSRSLEPFENITVAVGFAPGTFTLFDRSPFATPLGWLLAGTGLVSLGMLVLAISIRVRSLRDAPGRPVIVVEYLPPKNMTLMDGALLRHRRSRAIASQLVDFAVRGMITIIEQPVTARRNTWRLQLESAEGGTEHETRMLRYFFGSDLRPGATHDLGAASTTLSGRLVRLISHVSTDITNRLHWRRVLPTRRTLLPRLVSFVMIGVAIFLTIQLGDQGRATGWILAVIPLTVLSTTAIVSLLSKHPLTDEGAEINDHLTGLERYIRLAEADRMRVLQSPQGALRETPKMPGRAERLRLTERLLPWAVVFGHEKEWARELGTFYEEGSAPSWYRSSRPFSVAAFTAGVGSVSSTLSSSYSGSSSSGGSSGGGSSGGGGGGGGGGGV